MKTVQFSPLTKKGREGQTLRIPADAEFLLQNPDYTVFVNCGYYGEERRVFSWQGAVTFFNQKRA
ncbi:hypothetical protein HZU75_04235 [Chitinibacter fontanus]|uniref:Uncharacterized protein n=1 Tax=Chitinibacter fontanus TaxID=1737446 RepID=A0A7D5V8L9_9NEIS|nr:hypothetical protein [Chitinibacter fontanus]QLI80799.1 hypothetical protein HZU75_04235 [Chitinibacter fontanus]